MVPTAHLYDSPDNNLEPTSEDVRNQTFLYLEPTSEYVKNQTFLYNNHLVLFKKNKKPKKKQLQWITTEARQLKQKHT